MKKNDQTAKIFSQSIIDFDSDNHITDIQITLDNYGNIKINDYSAMSEIPFTEILKSKRDIYENNILYLSQFI